MDQEIDGLGGNGLWEVAQSSAVVFHQVEVVMFGSVEVLGDY